MPDDRNKSLGTEDDPPAGVQRWLISCDESGVDGSRFYGFGSLWMAWQRRGDFAASMAELRARHRYDHEFKWNRASRHNLAACRALVEMFFRQRWLSFHCIMIEKAQVRREFHDGDYDLARRKHFTMLLTNKIQRCRQQHRNREQTFRIWVDPIASRYKKADEVVEVIANSVLRKVFGRQRPVDKVITRDSKETDAIQLCDVLLGAVLAAWQGKSSGEPKDNLQKWIAHHLGWVDLKSDTRHWERKFNIWRFYDPTQGDRAIVSRDVDLKYKLPVGLTRIAN